MKIVIIGGGTAGSETAWRLRQQNKEIAITILEKSRYLQYSPCALPYLIGNEIKDSDRIFLFNKDFYAYNKINLKTEATAVKINRAKKEVWYEKKGRLESVAYDRLVLAGGGKPNIPPIPGLNKQKFYVLKNIDNAKQIKKILRPGKKALIIGSGYIGLELTDALLANQAEVTLLEAQNRLLPNVFDAEIADKIKAYMEKKGVSIITQAEIERVEKKKIITNKKTLPYDFLFLACGLSPDLKLAKQAGLVCGRGLVVDLEGRTSDENIYAVGDAVESTSLIGGKKSLSLLATTAVRQARVTADNILGVQSKNEPVLNTSISKFGRLIFGACGATHEYCRKNKIKAVSAFYAGQTKAEYYPGAKDIFVKIIALPNKKMIGCQIAGYEDIVGRINMAALAVKRGLTLDKFILSETCYNPALSPIFDPLLMAAEICLKKINALKKNS